MFVFLKLDKDNDEAKQMRVLRSPVMYSMARYLRAACKVGKCGSTNVFVDVLHGILYDSGLLMHVYDAGASFLPRFLLYVTYWHLSVA